MATAFKSQLHVLHLQKGNTPQTENKNTSGSLDALGNSLQDIEYDVHSKQAEDVANGIQDYVEEKQADLLALLPGQHTFLNRLMSKSITGQMAGRCFVPLLTLPGTSKTALRREEAKQEKN